MSVHIIYYKDGAKRMRPVLSRPEYLALRNSGEQLFNVAAIRKGDTKQKQHLVQMNYSCLPNADGTLKGSKQASNTVGMDIDFVAPTELSAAEQQAWLAERMVGVPELVLGKREALGLLMLERSASKGYHLVFRRRPELSQEENLRWASDLLGVKFDEKAKDITRVFFTTTADEKDLIWLDDEIFKESPPALPSVANGQFAPLCGAEATFSGFSEDPSRPIREGAVTCQEEISTTQTHSAPSLTGRAGGESEILGGESGSSLSFKGIPYSTIIAEWFRRTGGEPEEGERNVKLHKLAVNLRAICDNRKEVLMQIIPRYGLSEQELQSIVDSACKEGPKGISKLMDQIVREAPLSSPEGDTIDEETGVKLRIKALPIGLKESLTGVPATMQMPVLTALMPLLMTYADGVEVEYCDGKHQRLGAMAIIVGEQASGKSVCKDIADLWLRPIRREDEEARRREDEWRERRKGRKANEKAPEDPKVLVREVPVTISCSTLLRRMKNAQEHTLYSFGEELDTLRKSNGAGSWAAKYDIYRMAFDHGIWGQDYNSDQAESGMVRVAYNWSILGTYGAFRKCFTRDNIENGLSSRVMVAEMPSGLFAEMPKYCALPPQAEENVERAVELLRAAHGFIDTPRLRRAMATWVEEKRLEAARDLDRVKDIYRKRAAVIGFSCGVVHVLLSQRETKAAVDFALMMADYVLEKQMELFGPTLMQNYTEAASQSRYNTRNSRIFDRLPSTFTLSELATLKGDGFAPSAMRTIVWRWCKAGWLRPTDDGRWQKTTHDA